MLLIARRNFFSAASRNFFFALAAAVASYGARLSASTLRHPARAARRHRSFSSP